MELHFRKSDEGDRWIEDSVLIMEKIKKVPWYLDDGTGHVYVVGADQCYELFRAHVTFESLDKELGKGGAHEAFEKRDKKRGKGVKVLGIKRREQVLEVGTSMTVIGEVVKDDSGTIQIQRPFYVYSRTINIDEHIANLMSTKRSCKYISVGLIVLGACIMAGKAIHCILES